MSVAPVSPASQPKSSGRRRCSARKMETDWAWASRSSPRSAISCPRCQTRKPISPCSRARRVASDCDGQPPRRERAPLESRPEQATLKRWLRRWTKVRHREAAERTLLTGIASGLSPAALADALLAAETERALSPKSQAKVRDVLRRPCLSDPPDLYSADRMRPPQAG